MHFTEATSRARQALEEEIQTGDYLGKYGNKKAASVPRGRWLINN
jgi:hypothetical protein